MGNCSNCFTGASQCYGWEPSKEPQKGWSIALGHLFQVLQIAAGKLVGVLSHSVVSDSLRAHGLEPTRLHCPWTFPGKSTGVSINTPQTPFLPPPKTTVGSQLVPEEACLGYWILEAAFDIQITEQLSLPLGDRGFHSASREIAFARGHVPSIRQVHWPFKVSLG